MKKTKTMRVAVLLLALTLITSCFVGSTFAKYTSSATSEDSTATVAKWSIKVNGEEIAVENPNVEFDLFKVEDDNVDGDLLAPGTQGSFNLEVANASQVTAKYTITLAEINGSNVPIQYSVDGTDWKDSIAGLTLENELKAGVTMEKNTVYWRWVFEGTTEGAHAGQTDDADTKLGTAATAPTVTVTATINAIQVD